MKIIITLAIIALASAAFTVAETDGACTVTGEVDITSDDDYYVGVAYDCTDDITDSDGVAADAYENTNNYCSFVWVMVTSLSEAVDAAAATMSNTAYDATGDLVSSASFSTDLVEDTDYTLDGTTFSVEFTDVDLSDDTTTQWWTEDDGTAQVGATSWTEIDNNVDCEDGDFAVEVGLSSLAASLLF